MTASARLSAALLALIAAVTLVVHVRLGLADHPGRTLAVELWRTGRYFTILTVALLGAHFAVSALRGRVSAAASGAITLWIGIVGAVYHALLWRPLDGLRLYVDHSMHSVLPVLAALWWVAFAPKSDLRPLHAVFWLGWPAIYVIYALVRGSADGRYPYFFVDPSRIGWPMVGVWSLALGLVFWIGGLALVAAGRRMSGGRGNARQAG